MAQSRAHRFGWWLNLDADLELKKPYQYRTRRRHAQQMQARRGLLRLLTCDDPILQLDANAAVDVALCWAPTPSALAACAELGLRTPQAPPLETLQRVNHRRFILSLSEERDQRRFIERTEALRFEELRLEEPCAEALAPRATTNTQGGSRGAAPRWRAKRPYGFAGKGQRRLSPPLGPDDERWLAEAIRQGGVLLEPERAIVQEFSVHGYVDRDGLELGVPCQQQCDDHGSLRSLVRAEHLPDSWRYRLLEAAERTAHALLEAGYFGPFGIDAYAWQAQTGIRFQALGELNARFTVGWSIGFGMRRQVVLERYAEAHG